MVPPPSTPLATATTATAAIIAVNATAFSRSHGAWNAAKARRSEIVGPTKERVGSGGAHTDVGSRGGSGVTLPFAVYGVVGAGVFVGAAGSGFASEWTGGTARWTGWP